MAQTFRSTVRAPQFPTGVQWHNTTRPLTIEDLHGKLAILDFWTYG